jgi:hypothetical protein
MKTPTSSPRPSAGLLLALMGLITGFIASAYCQDRPHSALGTKALATLPTWVPTGNLNTPRNSHTATLLPNGDVLVVGGFGNAFNTLDGAELYDTTTGTWSVTGSLNAARIYHTATLLLAAGSAHLPTPRYPHPAGPHRQRWRVSLAAVSPTNQRQGRALHPNAYPQMGLRGPICDIRTTPRRSRTLAAFLQ